jgi:predicted dehydrogenase
MRKLRVAVIGAGRLGGFHAQKLAALDTVELVGVVDPSPERRQQLAARCHTREFADHHALLDQIDAAVIAAPTSRHHALGLELLNWGVHTFIEKPLTTTSAEADELVRSARRNGAVLQVGHVERFNPAWNAALPHLQQPKYIEAVRASGFSFRSTDVGVVLDLMIHDIDLMLSLVHSRVRKIDALGFSVLGGHEDVANARIEFQSGCVAVLNASRVSYQAERRMSVWSMGGFASIDFAASKTTVVHPSEPLLRREFDVDALSPEQTEHARQHFFEDHLRREEVACQPTDAIALELADFIESVETPRAPRVTGEHGREAILLAEQILAKIQTHAWDGRVDGPIGPMAVPGRDILPVPKWKIVPTDTPNERREAG